ncbi:MAG: hypothetical protein RBT75_21260, partial [Anaerolineae bacterium]|nr:hypothetical protein [Anaerolineae bacterium]
SKLFFGGGAVPGAASKTQKRSSVSVASVIFVVRLRPSTKITPPASLWRVKVSKGMVSPV